MRILVTGNMGYVGPVVVQHLRGRFPQAEILGLDSGLFAHCLTVPGPLPEARHLSAQHFGDTRDPPEALLRGTDVVVHLAAISNDPMGNRFEAVTDEINRFASLDLARRAGQAGVRAFVFASSCSVYGLADDGPPRRESDTLNPLTAYARSKIGTEEGLRQADNGAMTVTCLRFATACGMSDRLRLDLVLNDFVAGALVSGRVTVLSDGTPWRPLIAVTDMARAIEWAALRQPDAGGQFLAVNVGSDNWNYRVRDLADAVAREVPGTEVNINPDAPPDNRSYRVDFSLFRSLAPDHQPRETLAGTIQGLANGMRALSFDDPAFRESALVRLHVLSGHIEAGRLSPDLRWSARQAPTKVPAL